MEPETPFAFKTVTNNVHNDTKTRNTDTADRSHPSQSGALGRGPLCTASFFSPNLGNNSSQNGEESSPWFQTSVIGACFG